MEDTDSDEYPNSVPDNVEVSVRLVTYNHAGYIRDAIEGALNQETDFPFEIVIGEDDSSDGTREICIEYARQYPGKIRLFLRREEDKIYVNGKKTGRYNSIETRKACRGKYIAILEGDDYWIDRHKLQFQRDYLSKNEDCRVCGTRTLVKVEDKGAGVDRISKMSGPGGRLSCVDFIYGRIVNLCSVMVRSEDYGRIPNQWGLKYYWGDKTLMLSSTVTGGCCYVIPSVMSVYRVHGKGLWSSGGRDPAQTNQQLSDYFNHFSAAFPDVEVDAVKSAIKFHRLNALRLSGNWIAAVIFLLCNFLPIARFWKNSRI